MKNLNLVLAMVLFAVAPHVCNAWGSCTPIVIDLGNNGINLGQAGVGVYFDVNADGIRDHVQWVRRGGMLPPAVRESYQRQAMLYAWMLSHTEPGPVRAELVLIAIGSDDTERETLQPDLRMLEASVRRRVNGILHAWESEQRRAANR